METTSALPETLIEAVRQFSDPDVSLAFAASAKWPTGSECPNCGPCDPIFLKTRRLWKCRECKKQFSVKVGTIFEDSPIPLDKWMTAVWLLVNAKNGISSYEVGRAIGVSQGCAWFMGHRIRLALQDHPTIKLGGHVEMDETFIGGKARFMHKDRRARTIKGTGGMGKSAVMGLLERHGPDGHSRVRVKQVPNVRRKTLGPEVRQHVETGANVYSDALKSYEGLSDA